MKGGRRNAELRTDDLIARLAADGAAAPGPAPAVRLMAAAALGTGVAGLGGAALGVRPDVAALAPDAATMAKLVVAALVALAAGALTARLAAPGRPVAARGGLLAGVGIGLGLLVLLVPPAPAAMGLACAASVALLSLPALAATLGAVRRGSVLRLRAAGAAAGVVSAAAGLAGFALSCPAEAVAPMLAWYALAALVPVALGATAAPRLVPRLR